MADVAHELGAIRYVVNSPLSSKVAMFNNVAKQHKNSQLLNPFSGDSDMSKRSFSKDEYGRPVAGSLTEIRGAKANIHVCKEMLQLCQIIDDEGFSYSPENPALKVMRFGDLFNIYTLISDKVVGILLRARKYSLIDFEGEVLFQRRDDDVPIFMLKSLEEIKKFLQEKQDEVRRSVSPAPVGRRSVSPALSRETSPSPLASKPEEKSSLGAKENKSREASPVPTGNSACETLSKTEKNADVDTSKSDLKEKNELKNNNVEEAPKDNVTVVESNPKDVNDAEQANSQNKENVILIKIQAPETHVANGPNRVEENNTDANSDHNNVDSAHEDNGVAAQDQK